MAQAQPSATGETYDSSGWSQDDPSKVPAGTPQPQGPSPLAPQSPMAPQDQSDIGRMEAAKIGAETPYRETLLGILDDPNVATAHLEKVKDAPKPEDYKKYSMEFASAMAVLGAVAGRWTRHAGNASLNAFTGALNGWHQGNLEAYEQASKQWEEGAKQTIDNNNVELEKYHEIMSNKQANIDQMMAAMQLAGAESQNKIIMDFAGQKNYTAVFNAVDKMQQANQRLSSSVGQLTGVRAQQQEQVRGQIEYLNQHPDMLAQMKDSDYLKLKGAADTLGIPLAEKPATDPSRIQAAVDEVGQYRANPQTVLSRMPPQDRQAFWSQLQGQYPDWSQQTYNAQNTGGTAGARTEANRAANLDIILNSARAAIPQAMAASDAVPRGKWVAVNKAIQAYQSGTSDPKLATFAVANLQLAELWARAMNPTGVMREGDRELALKYLSTATSPESYRAVVNGIEQAVTREKGAVLTTEKERGAKTNTNPDDGSLDPNAASGNDGWGEVKVH